MRTLTGAVLLDQYAVPPVQVVNTMALILQIFLLCLQVVSSFSLTSIPNHSVGIDHWVSSVYWSSASMLKYGIVGIYKIPHCLLRKVFDTSKRGVGGYMLPRSGDISIVNLEWGIASSGIDTTINGEFYH